MRLSANKGPCGDSRPRLPALSYEGSGRAKLDDFPSLPTNLSFRTPFGRDDSSFRPTNLSFRTPFRREEPAFAWSSKDSRPHHVERTA
jgi:hypothetical protein